MNSGPGGFGHAPLSKSIVFATVITSALSQSGRLPPASIPPALAFLVQLFTFQTPGELLFGGLLLYWFRYIERQLGSAKYAVFAATTTSFAGLLHWALRVVFKPRFTLPWGPYMLVFASFVSFVVDVPGAHTYSLPMLRVKSSEKAYVYLAGLQLLLCGGKRSLLAGLLGIVSGCIYQLNVLKVRQWKLPRFFVRLCQRLTGTSRQQIYVSAPRIPRDQNTTAPLFQDTPAATTAAPPSPQAIEQLLQMGFSEAQARMALQHTSNNLADAIQLLLG